MKVWKCDHCDKEIGPVEEHNYTHYGDKPFPNPKLELEDKKEGKKTRITLVIDVKDKSLGLWYSSNWQFRELCQECSVVLVFLAASRWLKEAPAGTPRPDIATDYYV